MPRLLAAAVVIMTAAAASPLAAQSAAGVPAVQRAALPNVGLWGIGATPAGVPALNGAQWRTADVGAVDAALERLRGPLRSPAAQTLALRALLSGGAGPMGADAALAVRRIETAARFAPPQAVQEMLTRAPRIEENDTLSALAIDARFALGQTPQACALIQARPEAVDEASLKGRALCFALSGENAAADLAADVARAQGAADAWFFAALARKTGASAAAPPPARYGTGADVALSLAAGLAPAGEWTAGASPPRLAGLAQREDAPLALRLAAAGPAANAGLIDGRLHASLMDLAINAARAATPPQALSPALARRAAVRDAEAASAAAGAAAQPPAATAAAGAAPAPPPANVARLILDAVGAARSVAERAALARAYAVDMEALVGSPEAAALAPELTEAALWAGDLRLAGRMRAAAAGAPAARLAALDLALAAAGATSDGPALATAVARRIDAATDEALARRAGREIALLAALGLPVGSTATRFAVLRGMPQGARPSSAVLAALARAAARGAQGETALLAALALGEVEPDQIDGEAAATIIAALRAVGLDAEAQAAAREAILAAQNPPPRPAPARQPQPNPAPRPRR